VRDPDTRGAPVALCVSPHLDDAAFSCGGTLARLAAAGWAVHVATVFTASVPEPRGFALACQTDKGLPPDADYMAMRRDEDAVALAAVDAAPHWLALREAPHRGYADARSLFAGVHAGDDDAWREVAAALAPLVTRLAPALLLAPQALGGHVDHRHVVRAVGALCDDPRSAEPPPVAWYRDTPYVLRDPAARPPAPLHDGAAGALAAHAVPLDARALLARQAACAAYATQLPFQFGGAEAMRAAIAGLAVADGTAAGLAHAERLDARPRAATLLARVLRARPIAAADRGGAVTAGATH
jgi:LmbE family N-acetylglucosaminyl deacetylase